MKTSIRKNMICASVMFGAFTMLAACGANDQNQITATGHRYNNTKPKCATPQTVKDENGITVGMKVEVTGDTPGNMQSCVAATPVSTATPSTDSSSPDASASDMSDDALTTTTASTTVSDPVVIAPAAKSATTTPSTTAAATAPSAAYTAAMSDCSANLADVSIPSTFPATTSTLIAAKKQAGTYQLTKVVTVVNETSQNEIGLISASVDGFVAVNPAAGATIPGMTGTQCGGWPTNHGTLTATLILPNVIDAATMTPQSNRVDRFTAIDGGVTHMTKLPSPTAKVNPRQELQALQKTSGQPLQATFYQDSNGVVMIQVTQDQTSGAYHMKATSVGTYTLKTN